MDRLGETLEKAYELERELDEERDARIKQFTRAISEILERPDAGARLDFIARLMNDPEALEFTYKRIEPFLEKGGAIDCTN